jgi:hypothetical protein
MYRKPVPIQKPETTQFSVVKRIPRFRTIEEMKHRSAGAGLGIVWIDKKIEMLVQGLKDILESDI